MTAAVEKAVEERLERVRGKSKEGMAEKLMKIARSSASLEETTRLSRGIVVRRKGTAKGAQ